MAAARAAAAAVMICVVLAVAAAAAAQQCDVQQLSSCGPAFLFGVTPSATCCSALRAQQGCFCQYVKDPTYSSYLTSPTARKALAYCGIAYPTC